MEIPSLLPIRQLVEKPPLADVAGEVRRQWHASNLPKRLKRGARVAVAVGSRGIANLQTIVKATLESLRDMGTQPFVVAAMGSHGGGTAEGQRELLAEYGVSEAQLGVPVETDMTTVQIGTNRFGEPVYWDKNAWEADAVVTVSRVKAHTDFRGKIESGICKMLVIGLGKRDGAAQHHRWGVKGLREILPDSAALIIEKTKFLAGLAVLEDANEATARVQVVEKEKVLELEPGLLEEARRIMGRLPFDKLDLLVVGELGKNYSGAGMDPNVIGRLFMEGEKEFETPKIIRVCVLDVSPESHGNAVGIGLADITTDRLISQIDPVPFRMNTLTACFLLRSKLPLSFPTDRASIEMGVQTCWQPKLNELRMAVIANTLELAELWVSPTLAEEARGRSNLQVTGAAQPLPFDAQGNLQQEKLFPHSVRGRRAGK